jgi:hypothetical protein
MYKGKTHPIYSNPLEPYFDNNNPRPTDVFHFSCTACWRGYIATWKIEAGYLYLVELVHGTCHSEAKEIPLPIIFPTQKGPVKATWFSGALRTHQGKRLQYVHMGCGSVYENDLFLTIEKVKLIKEYIVDNTNNIHHTEKTQP